MNGLRISLRAAALLGGIALLAVALLAGMHALTRERIALERERARRAALALVLPPSLYDNDLLTDRIAVRAPAWLGSDAALDVWRARRGSTPAALVLEAVAPDGYTGPIQLLIGVHADGSISGVRVTAHRETPGLGDWIESGRSDWIQGFDRRSLGDPAATQWKVRRDGGVFDQFAGATVTPRAVVAAVRRALRYVERHGAALHAAPAGTTLDHPDAPDA